MRSAMLKIGIRADVVHDFFAPGRKHDTVMWQHRFATQYGSMLIQGLYYRFCIAHQIPPADHKVKPKVNDPLEKSP